MKLRKLTLSCFRNLEGADIDPGPRFNIIFGNNAQGKTNILESIYLLGTMKSFRSARNSELMMWGKDCCSVSGVVEREGISRVISLLVERSGKKVRVDQKHVARLSDFFGSLNVVIFSPEDMAMVKGMPDVRRRYLDRSIFSGDPSYLFLHHEYYRILKNRNMLLRNREKDGLEVWSEKLAESGARLIASRFAYLCEIEGLLRAFYGEIAGNGAEAGISYRPHQMDKGSLLEDAKGTLASAMLRSESEERRCGTTVVGPHRDDVDFLLRGKVMKHHASQGEQRSFVLALKMAEIEYIQRRYGDPPVLLLDDMTSELDDERNRNLMEFMAGREMQVFITTTSLDNIVLREIGPHQTFRVESGRILH